jgi:hypothetical protein
MTISQINLEQALRAIDDMAAYAGRNDSTMEREARRTLDELCWSPSGYPAPVIAALQRYGYRVSETGQLA